MARAKGEGNIFKRGSVYYLRFTVKGKTKTVSLKTKNKLEAQAKAKELLEPNSANNELEAAQFIAKAKGLISDKRIHIANGWERYFKSKKRTDCGEHTLKNYKRYWNSFLSFTQEHYSEVEYLDEVTHEIAEAYVDSLEMSPNTYNKYKNFLKLLFKTLGNDASLLINPFEGITSRTLSKQSWRELTPEEVNILHHLPKNEEWMLLQIGISTGMRLKDACLLEWKDVNFKSNKIVFLPSKTAKSEKIVHLPIISRFKESLKWAKQHVSNETYVIPNIAKMYLEKDYEVSRQIQKTFTKADITEGKVGFHSLRHTFVSECASAGVPLAIVQSIVGHGSPAMTRHYTHIDIESARKWLDPVVKNNDNELEVLLSQLLGDESLKQKIRELFRKESH